MLPNGIGRIDSLTPVSRVRKIRKYREEDREEQDPEEQKNPHPEPEDKVVKDVSEHDESDKHPHIDDFV